MARYRYHLSDGNGFMEAFEPLAPVSYVYAPFGESPVLRKRTKGNIVFPSRLFGTLTSDIGRRWYVLISKGPKEDHKGFFYMTECEIDYGTRSISAPLRTEDEYTGTLRKGQEKKNMLRGPAKTLAVVAETQLQMRTALEFLKDREAEGWELWSRGGPYNSRYQLGREVAPHQIDETFKWIEKEKLWCRGWSYGWTKDRNDGSKIYLGVTAHSDYPVRYKGPDIVFGRMAGKAYCVSPSQRMSNRVSVGYSARPFFQAMKGFVGLYGHGFRSDLFTAARNPATGNKNDLNYSHVIDAADFKDPKASSPSVRNEQSLLDVLNDLRLLFNGVWWLDGTELRFEHVNTFLGLKKTVDLSAEDIAMKAGFENFAAKWKERYGAVADNTPDTLVYMENVGNVTDEISDSPATIFATDLEAVNESPDSLDPDSLVLMVDGQGTDKWYSAGVVSGRQRTNAPLLTGNRMFYYYRHQRPRPSFSMAGAEYGSESTRKTMRQEAELFLGDDFDPASLVSTAFGEGLVTGAEHELATGWWKLEIVYDPYSFKP